MPDVVNVQHTRGGSSGIDAAPLSNGQILYDREAKRIFLDAVVDGTLTRIAMKEGTFTGTELEWNALTDTQKAVFTFVNITDDYEFHSDVFVGATASTDGQVGLVPRPMAGDQNKYLKGDGTFTTLDAVSIDSTGTASSTTVAYQRVGINSVYTAIDGTQYMLISNTSSTAYVFTNSAITSDSTIDVYTDTYGDNPSDVSITNNTCTVTFSAAQTRSVKIYIK